MGFANQFAMSTDIASAYPTQPINAMARSGLSDSVQSADLQGGDGGSFTFSDLLDIVNPLQQLPLVGSLYRAITGDTISTAARLIGGTIFGGPIGLASAAVNAGVDAVAGGDIGETLVAMFGGNKDTTTEVASAAYGKAMVLDDQYS